MKIKTGLGQDSHPFTAHKPLILGGVKIDYPLGLKGNSDADVVLHAVTNAISSISTRPILGKIADKLCAQGITDSSAYLKHALATLTPYNISHIAISIEAKEPRLSPYIDAMRMRISDLSSISIEDVGITATTGENLSAFGQGLGISALVIITAIKK